MVRREISDPGPVGARRSTQERTASEERMAMISHKRGTVWHAAINACEARSSPSPASWLIATNQPPSSTPSLPSSANVPADSGRAGNVRSCLRERAMATLPPCSPVMLVVAGGEESGCGQPVQHLGQLLQRCRGGRPSHRFLLKLCSLGEALRALLGILLGGQFRDEPSADVLADDAAVHFAAAGVVTT